MFNFYEVVFILTPVISQKQVNEAIKRMKAFFEKRKVKIYYQEHWGFNNLAYPIANKNMGYYELIQFKLKNQIPHNNFILDLKTKFKQDERIIRFIILKLNKYGFKYAERRKEKLFNKKNKKIFLI